MNNLSYELVVTPHDTLAFVVFDETGDLFSIAHTVCICGECPEPSMNEDQFIQNTLKMLRAIGAASDDCIICDPTMQGDVICCCDVEAVLSESESK